MTQVYEKRAILGSDNFSRLNHDVVTFHDTNTVIALVLTVVCSLLYIVLTGTYIKVFMMLYI